MIPLDKLKSVKHIIVHANCADGMASALILQDVLPEAEVEFVKYDSKAHKDMEVRPHCLFADFSPHKDLVQAFVEMEPIVLDHHKTQKDIVQAFKYGVFADESIEPGVAGASLAYQEVWVPLKQEELRHDPKQFEQANAVVENLATLAGVRDTWQREDPRFRKASEQAEGITWWPWEHLKGLKWSDWGDRFTQIGRISFEKKLKSAQEAADNPYRFTTPKGTSVVVFEGVRKTSDAAEYLHDDVDLVIGFALFPDDKTKQPVLRCSARSHTNINCAELAQRFEGGGGHTRAAGWHIPLKRDDPQPFTMIEKVVLDFEFASEMKDKVDVQAQVEVDVKSQDA